MRILIDGLSYFINEGELGEYTRYLVNGIKFNSEDSISIIRDKEITKRQESKNNITVKELYIDRIVMDYKPIDDLINNMGAEVYHCTNNGFSLDERFKYNCKVIATVHTIIPENYERFYNEKFLEKYYGSIQILDRLTDKIISPSTYIKEEIKSKLRIKDSKIQVILPKVTGKDILPTSYMSRVYIRSKFNFSKEFILYEGDLHPRKQLKEFLEVFKKLSERNSNLYFFIMTNVNRVNYNYYSELKKAIEKLFLRDRVIFMTNYNKMDRIHFYNTAKGIIDFSLFHGIGIHLLEGMKCGTNIICSDIPSFKEILGEYPLYLNLNLKFADRIMEDYLSEKNFFNLQQKNHEESNELYEVYKEVMKER